VKLTIHRGQERRELFFHSPVYCHGFLGENFTFLGVVYEMKNNALHISCVGRSVRPAVIQYHLPNSLLDYSEIRYISCTSFPAKASFVTTDSLKAIFTEGRQ